MIATKEVPAQVYNHPQRQTKRQTDKKVSLLYCSHNRLEYTKITFPRVLEECMLGYVDSLWIIDDGSIDGTYAFLYDIVMKNNSQLPDVHILSSQFGNSVDQLNYVMEESGKTPDYLVKVDNDIVIPSNYVETLLAIMDMDSNLAFLMMSECSGFPFIDKSFEYVYRPSNHIGGVGMFRGSCMVKEGLIPSENRFFGFTGYQQRICNKQDKKCGQMTHAANMNLDISIYSRANQYSEKGWARMFPQLPYKNGIV